MNVSEVNRTSRVSILLKTLGIAFIYALLFFNAFIMHDSYIALASAFCGITYTLLAGKGNPMCYLIGLTGSAFYIYLAYSNNLWGNCLLYAFCFVPMQVIGFFKWNKNLKPDKYEILKTTLCKKESFILFIVTSLISIFVIYLFLNSGDINPVADGLTTVFSVLGMYLTVRRAVEQWFVWMGVNLLSLIMWVIIAVNGTKICSTVLMWFVYFVLSIYFYFEWKKDIDSKTCE